MKPISKIALTFAITLFVAGGTFAAYKLLEKGKLKPEQMTGWRTEVLAGVVEQVTYSNGDYKKFDRDGNLTEEKNGKQIYSFQYENLQRYHDKWEDFYNITYNDSMRVVTMDDSIHAAVEYTFDSRGRIKSSLERPLPYINLKTEYIYNDESFLPSQIRYTISDKNDVHNGASAQTFAYTEIDGQGNWLKCKVEVKTEKETFTQELERIITYYTEAVLPQPAIAKIAADASADKKPDSDCLKNLKKLFAEKKYIYHWDECPDQITKWEEPFITGLDYMEKHSFEEFRGPRLSRQWEVRKIDVGAKTVGLIEWTPQIFFNEIDRYIPEYREVSDKIRSLWLNADYENEVMPIACTIIFYTINQGPGIGYIPMQKEYYKNAYAQVYFKNGLVVEGMERDFPGITSNPWGARVILDQRGNLVRFIPRR